MKNDRKLTALLLALLAMVVMTACGGGSGGGGGGQDYCITFQPSGTAAANRVTATQGAASVCQVVEVVVQMTDVTDVFTVSFDATFDATLFRYEGYDVSDSRMSADLADVQVLENEGSGWVNLGITRLNTTTGIDFSGTRTLVKLYFSMVSDDDQDSGSLTLSNGQVLGSETPPVEKNGITWFGGGLVIS